MVGYVLIEIFDLTATKTKEVVGGKELEERTGW